MDKPQSMSVKDYIIRTQSIRTNIPLKTIEAVIDNQFKGAHDAVKKNKAIEISGFGKFLYNKKKAQKKLDKQYSKEIAFKEKLALAVTDQEKASWQLKLDNIQKTIDQIKPKLQDEQAV